MRMEVFNMSNKLPPTGTAPTGDTRRRSLTTNQSITDKATCQSPIADLLHHGGNNATPCRDLVTLTGWTSREVTRAIQRERAAGMPICASGAGYFLPANDAELDAYLRSLSHRLREVQKTQRAIAATRQQRMSFGG